VAIERFEGKKRVAGEAVLDPLGKIEIVAMGRCKLPLCHLLARLDLDERVVEDLLDSLVMQDVAAHVTREGKAVPALGV
jgi:hypothetical protein